MTINTRQFFPLAKAYLCQDCDCVGNNSMRCPACASQVLMGLAGVLDREEEVKQINLLQFPARAA